MNQYLVRIVEREGPCRCNHWILCRNTGEEALRDTLRDIIRNGKRRLPKAYTDAVLKAYQAAKDQDDPDELNPITGIVPDLGGTTEPISYDVLRIR